MEWCLRHAESRARQAYPLAVIQIRLQIQIRLVKMKVPLQIRLSCLMNLALTPAQNQTQSSAQVMNLMLIINW